MAKLAQAFAKYVIRAKMTAKGVVEKPDVIGAIFGQTEGLLGADLDLRELQQTGRIGRIEVNIQTTKGKSTAEIIIPSSLDSGETSLIAASLETIDKVGPCDAEIKTENVEDVRNQKRQYTIERAKEILQTMMSQGTPDSHRISESIREAVRSWEITEYEGLSCGTELFESDEIIIVEGRADVINLLKNGIKNVIAIEGSKIPDSIIELSKQKIVTAFLDGDRGGDLDLKRLMAIANIDFVARAEEGKEVEELSKKQIFKSLREKVPINQITSKKIKSENKIENKLNLESAKFFYSLLEDLIGTRAAFLIDKNLQIVSKIPLNELNEIISDFANIYAMVFDGKINQSLIDLALQRKVKCVVGMEKTDNIKPGNINILTMNDLKKENNN
jgi:DNA primase